MRIYNKLIIAFLALSIIPMLGIGGIIFYNSEKSLERALSGESGSGKAVDYRGNKVLSAWRPNASLGWGLVAKIDEKEAFSRINKLRKLSILAILILVLLVSLVALVIARSIANPISRMRKGIEIIGRGNLDYKIGAVSDDEIGRLSQAFDAMAQNLKENMTSITNLDKEIAERKKAEEVLEKAYKQLKETQAELIQSEKMATLGRFSACIAHEVKNPLGIMLGGLEFLEKKLPCGDENTEKAFEMTKDAVLRANSILESLLHYSRPADLKTEVVKAPDIVMLVLEMLKARASLSNIAIDTEFAQDLLILVDKNQMHQALLNIVVNAMYAMPKGGVIHLKAYKAIIPEMVSEKMSCVIEVDDTGGGISKKNLSRLAEPFFTTKSRSAGTGLGIFITKMIIENHNGKLLVESAEGKGTIVKIVLPLAA